MKLFNQIWVFFASVQLAIFTLCSIALTSIIGTLVPQGESHSFYVTKFGEKISFFFQILDIPTMYSSWWFLGLLGLLCINLIVCSLDRFPSVWRIMSADNFNVSVERLQKMTCFRQWVASSEELTELDGISVFASCGWGSKNQAIDSGFLTFSEKGRWSRLGVYIVHVSILVIFLGAAIGSFFGFKGSVMIPELRGTDKIFTAHDSTAINLGFTIRNDSFGIEFYGNGMPKEYKSSLTVLENNREILKKDIKVNSPLTYKGITFYQSSYQAHQEFIVQATDTASQKSRQVSLPFQQQMVLEELKLQLGIINAEAAGQRAVRAKVWVKIGDDPPQTHWVNNNESISIKGNGKNYTLNVKQLYSTGLQVAKDPGVWIVYTGCALMLLGLSMAFFLSHRKIWLYQKTIDNKKMVILAGTTNKNKTSFAKVFAELENVTDQALYGHNHKNR